MPHNSPPVTAAPTKRESRRAIDLQFWGLVLILLIAAGVRLYGCATAPLWLDEFWSLELSVGRDTAHDHVPLDTMLNPGPVLTSMSVASPWWKIWTSMDEEPHPPPFFILLRFFRNVLGPSDLAARMLPLLASLACILLMYRVALELHGPAAAMWAALLMALSGQQLIFASELRSYSLIIALALGGCWAMVAIEKRGPTFARLAALGFCCFALVITHYFALGAVMALGIYALLRLKWPAMWRTILAMAIGGVLFCIVWGPFFLRQHGAFQLERAGATFLIETGPQHWVQTLYRLLAVPISELGPTSETVPQLVLTWIIFAIWLAPLFWIRRRPDLLLWYIFALGVLAILLVLDLTRSSKHLGYSRYIILASPGIYGIFAAAGARWPGWRKHILPACIALLCLCLWPASFLEFQSRTDWQEVDSLASQALASNDKIVLTAPPAEARSMYLCVQNYLSVAEHPVVVLTRPASPSVVAALHGKGQVWVIHAWPGELSTLLPGAKIRPISVVNGRVLIAQVEW